VILRTGTTDSAPAVALARESSRRRSLRASVLGFGILLGACAALVRDAVAQEPPGVGQAGAPGASAPLNSLELTPPTLPNAGQADLTMDQRLAHGGEFIATIERARQTIMRELQVARKDRDVVRVLCLSDKLNEVSVAQRSAEDRMEAARSAAERADQERVKHEYTVLEVINDRIRELVNESNQCIGQETGFIGEAEVSVSVDPNLPNANTTVGAMWSPPPPPPNIASPIE